VGFKSSGGVAFFAGITIPKGRAALGEACRHHFCIIIIPSNTCSGRGGQPGRYKSTGKN
jgi:hypothetical protein